MKNILSILVAIAFVAGTMLIGCNSPDKKAETSQEIIRDAQQNVAEANLALKDAIEQFKKESEEKLIANEKNIAAIQAKNLAMSENKLAELEQKNNELKEKLANYKAEGNEHWNSFKSEFSHDMNELGKAFSDLTVNNVN